MSEKKSYLTENLIKKLETIDTPTIANALELLYILPRTEGFLRPEIKSQTKISKTYIGNAVTGVISARHKSPDALERTDYYRAILSIPGPRMVVLHDLDYPATIGSYWGEVQGNIAKGLGCVGAVTDGGVRDLKEAEELGFPFWSKEVLVSHGYVHAIDYNIPVDVGGVYIKPGDIIAADIHGAIKIPHDVVHKIPDLAISLAEQESIVINASRDKNVSVDSLGEAWKKSAEKGAKESY